MSNREFTATRTMLANAFATAGAELLECMGVSSALAAIPNTEPPQYVVAGTLPMIAKVLPATDASSTAGAAKGGITSLEGIEVLDWSRDGMIDGTEFVRKDDVERLLSAAEKPTGDLTPVTTLTGEQLHKFYVEASGGVDEGLVAVANAAIAAHLERQAQQAESPVDQGHVLRTLRRLLDGSQPTDIEGSVMVIDNALKTGVSWSYDVAPPQGFIDYVKANYTGDVYFHDPEWHAMRLWNAAMKNVGARLAAPASQEGAHAALEEVRTAEARIASLEEQLAECSALSQKWAAAAGAADGRAEQASNLALEDAANAIASTNILGMTGSAAVTKLCAVIRALKTPASAERSGDHG